MEWLPHVPLGVWADHAVDWIKLNWSGLLDGITSSFNFLAGHLADFLLLFHPFLVAAVFVLVALWFRSIGFAIFTAVGFVAVTSMELWDPAMRTLSMVIVATLVALIIGIPIGILGAKSRIVSLILKPILDFLQTIPALVYLVPVVIFFSIGYAPGIVATIVFAIAPGIRLTELAIRQVDSETVEAGEAFGGTGWQILRGIQLPLGLPTIMAGVNQVIMLALSMVVIAGFVGAPGLGQEVTNAFGRVDVAHGFESGLSIVVLAIFLDRITGAVGQKNEKAVSTKLKVRRRRLAQAAADLEAGGATTPTKTDDEPAAAAPAGAAT